MNTSMVIILTLLTVGSLQGFLLAISMFHKKQPYIATWLALFSFEIINKVLFVAGVMPHLTQWFGFWSTFDLLYGPLLFLWVFSLIHQRPLNRWVLLHFSPGVLYFIVKAYSLWPLSIEQREWMISNFLMDVWVMPDTNFLQQCLHAASLFLPLFYACLALYQLIRYRLKFNFQYSEGLEVRFDWLLYMVVLHLVMWLFMLFALPLLQLSLTLGWVISYLPAVLWLNALAWFSLLYSHMILAKRHPVETVPETEKIEQTVELKPENNPEKYATTRLEPEAATDIEKQLTAIMAEGLFKQPRLALSELADQLELPSHWLSQVINDRFNCNFFDFVNNFRIQQVKLDLQDSKQSSLNILDIALNNGFNSKSTFNNVFKKATGQTPSQFRKSFN